MSKADRNIHKKTVYVHRQEFLRFEAHVLKGGSFSDWVREKIREELVKIFGAIKTYYLEQERELDGMVAREEEKEAFKEMLKKADSEEIEIDWEE